MPNVNKELSKAIGTTTSSPFMEILRKGEYSYDDLVDIEGFTGGWRNRAMQVESVDGLSAKDKAFYDVCQESIKFTEEKGIASPFSREEMDRILDHLIDQDLIQPQVVFR